LGLKTHTISLFSAYLDTGKNLDERGLSASRREMLFFVLVFSFNCYVKSVGFVR
jgi:hypothetical protein